MKKFRTGFLRSPIVPNTVPKIRQKNIIPSVFVPSLQTKNINRVIGVNCVLTFGIQKIRVSKTSIHIHSVYYVFQNNFLISVSDTLRTLSFSDDTMFTIQFVGGALKLYNEYNAKFIKFMKNEILLVFDLFERCVVCVHVGRIFS